MEDTQLIKFVPTTSAPSTKQLNPALCPHLLEDIQKVICEVENEAANAQLEQQGKRLYKDVSAMRDVAEFMEDPVTREIYNKYFTNWGDITSIMLFFRLYARLDSYIEKNNLDLNGYHKIAIMDKLLKNRDINHLVCRNMAHWMRTTAKTDLPAVEDHQQFEHENLLE